MTDPNRLLDESQSPQTRALLRAGRAETSPDGFSERLLASMAAAAATSAVSSAAAASLGTGAKPSGSVAGAAPSGGAVSGLGLAVTKWVAVGMLGGGLLAAGAEHALSPRPEPARSSAVANSIARPPAPPAPDTVAFPVNADPVAADSAAAVNVAPIAARERGAAPVVATDVHGSALSREVEIIDRVRRALAAGNTALALSELDDFERLSHTGVLTREARVLRIQALRDAGDTSGAHELTARYLAEFPNDAHAARLRAQDAQHVNEKP